MPQAIIIFRLEPSENLRIGSTLMTFSVVDADTFIGNVSYQVHAGNDEGISMLFPLIRNITVITCLNFKYVLNICFDEIDYIHVKYV